MKQLFLLLLSTSFMLSSMAQQDGWTPLFNGKDLQGWQQLNGKAKYTVQNGVIVGETVYGEPNSFLSSSKTIDSSKRKRGTG